MHERVMVIRTHCQMIIRSSAKIAGYETGFREKTAVAWLRAGTGHSLFSILPYQSVTYLSEQ